MESQSRYALPSGPRSAVLVIICCIALRATKTIVHTVLRASENRITKRDGEKRKRN